jgi:hypothetical protein
MKKPPGIACRDGFFNVRRDFSKTAGIRVKPGGIMPELPEDNL